MFKSINKTLPERLLLNGGALSLPRNYNDNDKAFFEPHFNYKLLKPYVRIIRSGILLKNGTILNWSLKPVQESFPWISWGSNYNSGFWLVTLFKGLFTLNFKFNIFKKVSVVFNVFSNNYFHWITEVLPKIHYLQNTCSDIVFLIPEDFDQDYQLSTLKICGANIIFFRENLVFFKDMLLFSGFSEFPGYYEPGSLFPVRLKILQAVTSKKSQNSLIYITRKNAHRRRASNEEEIRLILKRYDFEIYDFDNSSFNDIVEISRNAKVLVSIHGAALTNMLFMEKGSIVFELQKEHVVIDKCYYFLANALGIQYYYQTCQPLNPQESHVLTDIFVDIKLFEENIKLILNNFGEASLYF